MKIFAISDLHLCFSTPKKTMEIFSDIWKDYQNKIKKNWLNKISSNDYILIPGDISWAMKLKDALLDLEWLDSLPGKKIIIRGNHDYWWPSKTKLKNALPPSITFLQNEALSFNDITIAGARLWDTEDFNFDEYIEFSNIAQKPNGLEEKLQKDLLKNIYERELQRLRLSLEQINKNAKTKIVMTHFPPISADLKDSKASKILEEYDINICIFGHLHNLKKEKKLFGEKNNIRYILTSADYINFSPLEIF